MPRKYRGMFSRDLSVDLGHDNTLIYVKDKGMVSVAELRNESRSQQTDAVNIEIKQNSGNQVVLPAAENFSIAHHTQPEEQREITAQDEGASVLLMSDDKCTDNKKIIDCRADLNQLIPFKYTWIWDKYLSVGSTARISDMLMQDSTKEVDVQLEKMVETFDTYIPEPLRNADGTPVYVHANESRACTTCNR